MPQLIPHPPTPRYFDQGFRLLAAFDFRRAVLSFRTAAAADASCALCAWGEALALGPNLNSFDEPRQGMLVWLVGQVDAGVGMGWVVDGSSWWLMVVEYWNTMGVVTQPGPDITLSLRLLASIPAAFQRAQDAADLLERQVSQSQVSRGLIRALQTRYLPTAAAYVRAEAELTQSYAEAMELVLSQVEPTDVNYANVVALTADALMNTHPWDYWVPAGSGKHLRPEAQRAMKMLNQAPGLCHPA